MSFLLVLKEICETVQTFPTSKVYFSMSKIHKWLLKYAYYNAFDHEVEIKVQNMIVRENEL